MLKKQTERLRDLSKNDMEQLIHELGTHQIELEMQNEELRRAQVEIEAARRKYAELYELAPVGYFTLDKSGLILEANLAGASMLGVRKRLLLNKPLSRFIDPADQKTFSAHLAGMKVNPVKAVCEAKLRRKDGTEFFAQLQSIPAEDSKGNASHISTAVIDITERRRAEEAVARSKSEFEAIFNSITDAVVFADTQRRVVMVNPAVTKIFGYASEELKGKSAEIFYTDKSSFEKTGREVYLGGDGKNKKPFEIKYRRKDGSVFDAETLGAEVRGPQGNIIGFFGIHRDITERKRAEEDLKKSEEKYRSIFEGANDGIVACDLKSERFLFANRRFTELTGYSGDEIVKLGVKDIHPPEDLPYVLEEFHKIAAGGIKGTTEIPILKKDGSIIYCDIGSSFLGDTILLGFFRDVTERKKAEARLAADLAALTRMHALSGKLLEAGEIQPLLQKVMDAAVAIMGAERGTMQLLQGDSLRIVAHYGHQKPFLEFFASAENQASVCGEAMQCGERVVVPDVETSPLFAGTPSLAVLREAGVRAVQSTPLISRTGALLGILTTQWGVPYGPDEHDLWRIDLLARQAADLIESARAEEALKESQRFVQKIADAAPNILYIFNIIEHNLVYVNSMLTQLLGYTLEEIQNMGESLYREIIHPEDLLKINEHREKGSLSNSKGVMEIELRVRHANGEWRWISTRNVVFSRTEDGLPKEVLGVAEDITERKRAEEALKQAHVELKRRAYELDAVNRELEAFSYTVSHDLKSPLRSIDGFTTALLEDCTGKLDATGRDYLARVNSAALRMNQLIDALLNMARLTRGELHEKTLDLSSLAQVITHELQKQEPRRQVEFMIAEKIKVKGDLTMLQVMLQNLLDNAWKFTSKHATAKIEFGVVDMGGRTVYFVRDDGAGFDMEYAEKLFHPFKRLHTESEFPGLGIGLAIAHRIITRHNGRIWAESAPEKGATFYFTL